MGDLGVGREPVFVIGREGELLGIGEAAWLASRHYISLEMKGVSVGEGESLVFSVPSEALRVFSGAGSQDAAA